MDLRARLQATTALALFLLPFALPAQEPPAPPSRTDAAPATPAVPQQRGRANMTETPHCRESAEERPPIPAETKSETKHDWTAGGRAVHYTATAGNLVIRDEETGLTAASSMWPTPKTAPREEPARDVPLQRRPGLGFALAAYGLGRAGACRHVQPGSHRPGPVPLGAERYRLIDKTDLVFIDAPQLASRAPWAAARRKTLRAWTRT